jgi:hypothetical protein
MYFLFQEVPPVVVKKERGVDRAAGRQTPGYRVRAQGNDVESEKLLLGFFKRQSPLFTDN